MTKIDWGKERGRLESLYASMSEGELQEVADDVDSLTDVARAALRAEMIRRGMQAPPELVPAKESEESARPITKPVVIGRYRDPYAAAIARSILESAGIQSFLADDNVIRMNWLYSNALGGIKLLVKDEDSAAARELLEAQIPEKFEVEGAGEYEQPRCPNCNSLDVSFQELDRKMAHTGLLISLPIPAVKHGWNCHACGQNWEPDADKPHE